MTVHYRVKDVLRESGVHITLETWNLVSETPQGYWLKLGNCPLWGTKQQQRKRGLLKWVSKSSHKKYCYPSMGEAMDSYYRRKLNQQYHLTRQLEQVDLVLANYDKLKDSPPEDFKAVYEGIKLGHTKTSSELRWE